MALTSDDRYIICGSTNSTLVLYSVATGNPLHTFGTYENEDPSSGNSKNIYIISHTICTRAQKTVPLPLQLRKAHKISKLFTI